MISLRCPASEKIRAAVRYLTRRTRCSEGQFAIDDRQLLLVC